MIYAQHHDPASVRCETVIDGLVCGEPATHTRSRPFQDAGHTWWRHEPICESCTHALRSREIDQWLQEIGAHITRVADLGAALEANEQGRHAAFVAGLAMEGRAGLLYLPKTRPIVAVFPSYVYEVAKEAARLARLALGEP